MNYSIFDDEFEEKFPEYKSEIFSLIGDLIEKNKVLEFKKFVKKNMTGTRNYYIFLFALKTMQNVKRGDSFDIAPFKAFTFLPDVTFFQTMCMVILKFFKNGKEFAQYYNIEIPQKQNMDNSSKEVDKKIQDKFGSESLKNTTINQHANQLENSNESKIENALSAHRKQNEKLDSKQSVAQTSTVKKFSSIKKIVPGIK